MVDILDPEMNLASDDEDEESYVAEVPPEEASTTEATKTEAPRENSSGSVVLS